MKRRYFIVALALLLLSTAVHGAMTYDQTYYRNNRAYLGSATSNDPLYNLWGTLEGLYEGTADFDAIRIIESTGTNYTKIIGGNQSASLTYTLPTAYGTTGYVLSATDAGVMSWVANAGTFSGGTITSDISMTNGEYIRPSTTTAEVLGLQVYDVDGTAWRNLIMGTNGDTPAIAIGAATTSLAVTSTGLNVSTAGAVTGVTTLVASGAVTATGGLTLQNGATITNGTSSEIKFTSTEDLTLDMDAATNVVGLSSTTGVNGLAFGTVDDLSGIGTIAFDAAASTVTLTSTGDAQDLTISLAGATNSSLVLSSTGTAADALTISTSAGGMDITVAGAAAGEDLDLSADSSINIISSEAAADDAIVIQTTGAGSGMRITSLADIDITTTGEAGEDITIQDAGGSINIIANENLAGTIIIATTGGGGTSEDITVTNDQGTGAASIGLISTAGGITLTAGDDFAFTATDDITINGGSAGSIINLGTNTHGDAIHIGDNDTAADTITIGSDKDTTSIKGVAMTVGSTAGAAATTIQSGTGDLALTSTDDITLTTNTTTTDNITITNTPGTATNAIAIQATAGGIDIDTAAAKILDIDAGTIQIDTKTAGAGAIALTANQGAADTITVTNTQGNTAGAIALTSTAGGITLTAAAGGISTISAKNVGAVVAGTCTAVEYQNNGHHRTVLTLLTGATFNLEDKDDGNGIKIYDFPEGNVIMLGAFADVVVTAAAGVTGAYNMAVGTTAAADADNDLTTTEADFIIKTAVTQGSNQDFHGLCAATAAGVILVPFNGTAGGKDVYLNASVAAGNINAGAAITAQSGTIVLEWIYLGDF